MIVFAVAIFYSTWISAQVISPKNPKYTWSVFAGPSYVFFKGDPQFNMNQLGVTKISFTAGLEVSKSISNRLALSTQFQYNRKGSKTNADLMVPPDYYNNPPTNNLAPEPALLKGNLSLDYLTISILPGYSFGKEQRFNLRVGVFTSRLVGAIYYREEIQGGVVKRRESVNLFQVDHYKEFDMGWICAIQYRGIAIGSVRIVPAVQASLGLLNIVNVAPGILPVRTNQISFAFSVSKIADK